jgi:hypothetical protein
MRVAWLISHPIRQLEESSEQLLAQYSVGDYLLERSAHAGEPRIPLALADLEAEVAHAQPRMAALL